jgi:ADP-ribose pyrophosphatase YjhB (NUDIX family)
MRQTRLETMSYCPECGGVLGERFVHGKLRPACDRCRFVHYANPKVAVGVIVAIDGRVLLCRRDLEPGRGRWSFPSGYVDAGEPVQAAARREVWEETGLEVEVERLVGVYDSPNRPVVYVVYSGRAVGGELRAREEVQEVGYFDLDVLPVLAFEHDTRILADWRQGGQAQ